MVECSIVKLNEVKSDVESSRVKESHGTVM